MADGSLWEGLQQALATQPEPRLWDAFTQQQPSDRMVWRMMPPSRNVDDRRGQGTTLADLAQMASMALINSPPPWHKSNPIFPSGPYSQDISNAANQERFRSELTRMRDMSDAKSRNEAWLRSIEGGQQ